MSSVNLDSTTLGRFWSALGEPDRTDQPVATDIRRFIEVTSGTEDADLRATYEAVMALLAVSPVHQLPQGPIGQVGIGSPLTHLAAPFVQTVHNPPIELTTDWFIALNPTDPGVFFIYYQDGGLKKFLFLEASDGSGLILFTLGREGNLVTGFVPTAPGGSVLEKIRNTQKGGNSLVLKNKLSTFPYQQIDGAELVIIDDKPPANEAGQPGLNASAIRALSVIDKKAYSHGRPTGEFIPVEGGLRVIEIREDESKIENPPLFLPEVDPTRAVTVNFGPHPPFSVEWFDSLPDQHPSVFYMQQKGEPRSKHVFVSSVMKGFFAWITKNKQGRLVFDVFDLSQPDRRNKFDAIRTILTATQKKDLIEVHIPTREPHTPYFLDESNTPNGSRLVIRGSPSRLKREGDHLHLKVSITSGPEQNFYFYVSDDPFGLRSGTTKHSDAIHGIGGLGELSVDNFRSFKKGKEGIVVLPARGWKFLAINTPTGLKLVTLSSLFDRTASPELVLIDIPYGTSGADPVGRAFAQALKDKQRTLKLNERDRAWLVRYCRAHHQVITKDGMPLPEVALEGGVSGDMTPPPHATFRVRLAGGDSLRSLYMETDPPSRYFALVDVDSRPESVKILIYHKEEEFATYRLVRAALRPEGSKWVDDGELLKAAIPNAGDPSRLPPLIQRGNLWFLQITENGQTKEHKLIFPPNPPFVEEWGRPDDEAVGKPVLNDQERQQYDSSAAEINPDEWWPYNPGWMSNWMDDRKKVSERGNYFELTSDEGKIQYYAINMGKGVVVYQRTGKKDFSIGFVSGDQLEMVASLLDEKTGNGRLKELITPINFYPIVRDRPWDRHSLVAHPEFGPLIIVFKRLENHSIRPVFKEVDPARHMFWVQGQLDHGGKVSPKTTFTPKWFDELLDSHPSVIYDSNGQKFVYLQHEPGDDEFAIITKMQDEPYLIILDTKRHQDLHESIRKGLAEPGPKKVLKGQKQEVGIFPKIPPIQLKWATDGQGEKMFRDDDDAAKAKNLYFVHVDEGHIQMTQIPVGKKKDASHKGHYYFAPDNPFNLDPAKGLRPYSREWFEALPKDAPGVFFMAKRKHLFFEAQDGESWLLVTQAPDRTLYAAVLEPSEPRENEDEKSREWRISSNKNLETFVDMIRAALQGDRQLEGVRDKAVYKSWEGNHYRSFYLKGVEGEGGDLWHGNFNILTSVGAELGSESLRVEGENIWHYKREKDGYVDTLFKPMALPAPVEKLFSKEWFADLPETHPAVFYVKGKYGLTQKMVYLEIDNVPSMFSFLALMPDGKFVFSFLDESMTQAKDVIAMRQAMLSALGKGISGAINDEDMADHILAKTAVIDLTDFDLPRGKSLPVADGLHIKVRVDGETLAVTPNSKKHDSVEQRFYLANRLPTRLLLEKSFGELQQKGLGPISIDELAHFFETIPTEAGDVFVEAFEEGVKTTYFALGANDGTIIIRKKEGKANLHAAIVPASDYHTLLDIRSLESEAELAKLFGGLAYHPVTYHRAGDSYPVVIHPQVGPLIFVKAAPNELSIPVGIQFPDTALAEALFHDPHKPTKGIPYSKEWFDALPEEHPSVFTLVADNKERRKIVYLTKQGENGFGLLFLNEDGRMVFQSYDRNRNIPVYEAIKIILLSDGSRETSSAKIRDAISQHANFYIDDFMPHGEDGKMYPSAMRGQAMFLKVHEEHIVLTMITGPKRQKRVFGLTSYPFGAESVEFLKRRMEREKPAADVGAGSLRPEEGAETAPLPEALVRFAAITRPIPRFFITGISQPVNKFFTIVEAPIPINVKINVPKDSGIMAVRDLFRKKYPGKFTVDIRWGEKGTPIRYEAIQQDYTLVLTPPPEAPQGKILISREHLSIDVGAGLKPALTMSEWVDREVWGPSVTIDNRPETRDQKHEIQITAQNDADEALYTAILPIWVMLDGLSGLSVKPGEWGMKIPYKEGQEAAIAVLIDRTAEVYRASLAQNRNPSLVVERVPLPLTPTLSPKGEGVTPSVGAGSPRPSMVPHVGAETAPLPDTKPLPAPEPAPLPDIPTAPEPEVFFVESRIEGEDGKIYADPFSLTITTQKNPETGEEKIVRATVKLAEEVAGVFGVGSRGTLPLTLSLSPKGEGIIRFDFPALDTLVFHLKKDEQGKWVAVREMLTHEWELTGCSPSPPPSPQEGEGVLVGHLPGETKIEIPLSPYPQGVGVKLPANVQRFLIPREQIAKLRHWCLLIGAPFFFEEGRHTDVEVVLVTGLKNRTSALFVPFKRNSDFSLPIRARYLSDREFALIEKALASVPVEGASSTEPIKIEGGIFAPPTMDEHKIPAGEIFLPTAETLSWIRDIFLRRDSGAAPFASGTRLEQRLEFESAHGLVISIPVRWKHRPRNPFELDVDHRERFIEFYIRGQKEKTLQRAATDLRIHEQGGNWQLYVMTHVGDGKVRPFNLSAVICPHSPVLMALVNTLDSSKSMENHLAYRRSAVAELNGHLLNFFGGKLEDLPPIYIPSSAITLGKGRAVTLSFRSEEGAAGELRAELSGLSLSKTDRRIDFDETLTLKFGDEVILLEQTASDSADLVVLREIPKNDSSAARVFEWSPALGTISLKKVHPKEGAETAPLLELLDAQGIPVVSSGETVPDANDPDETDDPDKEKTRFRQGSTVTVPSEIPVLPETNQGFSLPSEVIKLSDPDLVSELLEKIDLHDSIFLPDEVTLFSEALIGRDQEFFTFVAQNGIILQVPMKAEKEEPFRYLADEEADSIFGIEGARLLIPDPDDKEVYYEVPTAVFHEKTPSGRNQNLLELQIVGAAHLNLNLRMISSRETYGDKAVFGFIAEEIGRESKVPDANVRAWLKAWIQYLNLNERPPLYSLDAKTLSIEAGKSETVVLSDGRLLDLSVKHVGENHYELIGLAPNLDYLEGEGGARSGGSFKVFRAPDGSALFYLWDEKTQQFLNLVISAEGEVWIWPRRHHIREFLNPPSSTDYPMYAIDGWLYVTEARSIASRRTLSDDAEKIFEITAVIGRWEGSTPASLMPDAGDKLARVRFEVVQKEDGSLAVRPGKISPAEKDGGANFPLGEDFQIEIVEDEWGERKGRVRLVFYQPEGALIGSGQRKEKSNPYGWLTFSNREALIGDRKNFHVEKAHFHLARYRETNLMPHDRGFLTKRAGVRTVIPALSEGRERESTDGNRVQGGAPQISEVSNTGSPPQGVTRGGDDMLFASLSQTEKGRVFLESFKSTEARADDLPILLGAMEYLGLVGEDGSYDDSLLASLAFYAAMQNPNVKREELIKKVGAQGLAPEPVVPLPPATLPLTPSTLLRAGPALSPKGEGDIGLPPPRLSAEVRLRRTKEEGGRVGERVATSALAEQISTILDEVKAILHTTKQTTLGYSMIESDYRKLKHHDGPVTDLLKKTALALLKNAKKMKEGTLYQEIKDPVARLSAKARENPDIVRAVRFVCELIEKKSRKKPLTPDEFIEAMKKERMGTLSLVWWPYVREVILRNKDRVTEDLHFGVMMLRELSRQVRTSVEKIRPGFRGSAVEDDLSDVGAGLRPAPTAEADDEALGKKGKGRKGGGGSSAPPSISSGGGAKGVDRSGTKKKSGGRKKGASPVKLVGGVGWAGWRLVSSEQELDLVAEELVKPKRPVRSPAHLPVGLPATSMPLRNLITVIR